MKEVSINLEKLRHSASHILAQAVLELFPNVKLGIGPVIENGFYYDFDKRDGFSPEDIEKIKKRMSEIVKRDLKIERKEASRAEAKKILKDQPYKLELLDELKGTISFYKQGDFIDLCKGPHLSRTGDLKAFELLNVAGAYWKGDSKRPMLQRIYGTAFPSKKELDDYLLLLEEAKKRDHKIIGEQMGLFMLHELIGKGLPVWLPRGEIVKRELERFAIETEERAGYVRISTPHLAKEALFKKSGHLPHYKESMYPPMVMDDGTYYLKSMNCPMHHLVFSNGVRSYKELPIRIAEYGTVYRNELSGTLSGLLRVRMLSMNDAHIYCTKDQIAHEIELAVSMIKYYYDIFKLKDYYFRLSLWDPKNKEKYIDEPSNWNYCEDQLRKALKKLKVKFVEAKDEAAFYGPKIDVQFKTILRREETLSTIQLDFAAKKRFNFKYFDREGKANNDVFVIHRAPLSTHERFIAFLIEHYAGKFPLWLSPVQVKILTVTDRNLKFAKELYEKFRANGIRTELDDRNETIGKKVRDAQIEKANYCVTIGDKEDKSGALAVRNREGKTEFGVNVNKFIDKILKEINERC